MSNPYYEESTYISDPRVISTTLGVSFTYHGGVFFIRPDTNGAWDIVDADGTRRGYSDGPIDAAIRQFLGPPDVQRASSTRDRRQRACVSLVKPLDRSDQRGMFFGMISYPSFEEVLAGLGDKFAAAMAGAADIAGTDLSDLRAFRADWVAESSVRGLANFIHDRLWVHLVAAGDSIPEVQVVDKEPLREIYVGLRYRLRVKRHQQDGAVRSYPTLAALSFFTQAAQPTLEGLEEVRLCTGYEWDPETREIGPAVLSLRDGKDKVIWCHELPEPTTGTGGIPFNLPTTPGPVPPTIAIDREAPKEAKPGSAAAKA